MIIAKSIDHTLHITLSLADFQYRFGNMDAVLRHTQDATIHDMRHWSIWMQFYVVPRTLYTLQIFWEGRRCPRIDGQEDKSPALFHHGLRRRLLMMLRDPYTRGVTFSVSPNMGVVTGYCIFSWNGLVNFQPEDGLR